MFIREIRRLVVVACVIVLIFVASSRALDLAPYLADNYSPLDIHNMDLSIMSEDFLDYDVFLSGAEWHGTQANYELHYSMATALHQQAGVNYLLLSAGYGTTAMYSIYLETGDEVDLNIIHDEISFSNSSNEEHRVFWRNLYQYNQSQPEDDRIILLGIDLENVPRTAVRYLLSLPGAEQLPLLTPPNQFRPTTEELNNYVTRLELDIQADRDKYTLALGENFTELELVLDNLADTVRANLDRDTFYEVREEIMYSNFLRAYNSHPRGKYFGHMTMEHIYQHPAESPRLEDADSLAILMNKDDSPVQGKVLSIAATYADSIFRFNWGRYYDMEIYDDFLTDLGAFTSLADADYTLFNLKGENSPFTTENFTIKNPNGGVTTDYFHYLMVIKNSPMASPNKR